MSTISLWIDTDPSGLVWTGLDCDDDLAILMALALQQRGLLQVEGISVCGGNAPLRHTWKDIRRLLEYAGSSITPIKGYGWKSMQILSHKGIFRRIVPMLDTDGSNQATQAIVERAKLEPKLKVLALGPPTNVANAIQVDPSGFGHIYLMGGELTGQPMDLNLRSDRNAARTVIQADIPKTIIPIQTCGQVVVTSDDLKRFECPEMAVCALIPKMNQQLQFMPRFVNTVVRQRMLANSGSESPWEPSVNLNKGFIPWDVIALMAIVFPEEFDGWKYHRVELPTCDGGEPCGANMVVLETINGNFSDWRGIVRTPHFVRNETRILEKMITLLNSLPAAQDRVPHLHWGFLGPLIGSFVAAIIFLHGIARFWYHR